MRHGVRKDLESEPDIPSKSSGDHPSTSQSLEQTNKNSTPDGCKSILGQNLGCYFCNDITAPGNVSVYRVMMLLVHFFNIMC